MSSWRPQRPKKWKCRWQKRPNKTNTVGSNKKMLILDDVFLGVDMLCWDSVKCVLFHMFGVRNWGSKRSSGEKWTTKTVYVASVHKQNHLEVPVFSLFHENKGYERVDVWRLDQQTWKCKSIDPHQNIEINQLSHIVISATQMPRLVWWLQA